MTETTCANTAWTSIKTSVTTVPTIVSALGADILYNTTEAAASLTDGTRLKSGFQVVLPVGSKLYVIASGAATAGVHYQDFGA